MQKSPFKFLDSFTRDDRDIFFGRDREIEELHSRVFESKILIVYGTSGTGKSSLINCGLANKFHDSDWLPVSIRRGTDINRSLLDALAKSALTKGPFEKIAGSGSEKYNLERLLRSVYLDHFKPVFLIFDQFEELFIFGQKEEKDELIRNVARVLDSDIQCRFIFSLREEYLAGVTEFEKVIPSFLSNRIRIEKMTRQNAIQTIEGPCRVNKIQVDPGFAEKLLEKLNPETPEVELTWLQIYLDKILRIARGEENKAERFTVDLLEKAGDVKDILGSFLEEQISQLSDPDTGLVILKSFVSVKGTKRQITEDEVTEFSSTFGKKTDRETVREMIQRFIRLRILRDKDENGRYELRHDSLATKIFEKITLVEKELLEIKYFIDNAFANYEKRNLLLTDEDLKYIAPYEDKLFLSDRSQRFIDQSKQAIYRARRRRQNLAIAAASVIIIVLSFFTIWAMKEKKNAVAQQQIAEQQKNAAVTARDEAESARKEAETSRLKAEENAKIAEEARRQSDKSRQEAERASKAALEQKRIAEQMSSVAKEQAKKAEEERQLADQQKNLAVAAEEKARRLSRLSTAQNLALTSMTLERKPGIMGLLAVQAYNFNTENGGYSEDPVIFKAMSKAYSVLDNSKHSVLSGSSGEILTLAENNGEIVGADMDGNIVKWDQDGNKSIVPDNQADSYINFIRFSPSGKMLLTSRENNQLRLKRTDQDNQEGVSLKGHHGLINEACWSSDETYLATGGTDSTILVRDTGSSSGDPILKLKAGSSVRALAFCGSDTLVSACEDGSLYVWNLKNATGQKVYEASDQKVMCLAWDRLRGYLTAGCSNGIIMIFNIRTVPVRSGNLAYIIAGIDHIVFSSDFSIMAASSWDKTIRIFNYHKYFELSNAVAGVAVFDNLNARTRSMILTDDNRLVAGMSDRSIRIWETSSLKLALKICSIVQRDMIPGEWNDYIGTEIPYEKTCDRKR